MLDVWPHLPIMIWVIQEPWDSDEGTSRVNNVVALLDSKHHDRICEITLVIPPSLWERIAPATQKPFPELRTLYIRTSPNDDRAPVFSNLFLSRSTPHLRLLGLYCIQVPFPAMQELLSSCNNLVGLSLVDIPHSGYISPDMVVTCLAALPRLKRLWLGFQSPRSRPDPQSRRPPPFTRSVLPALASLEFHGAYEYLEELVAQIDAPRLNNLTIYFFMDLMFDVPQLHRFISHLEKPKRYNQATVHFSQVNATMTLSPPTSMVDSGHFSFAILCRESDWLLSSMTQLCRAILPLFPSLERLNVMDDLGTPLHWKDDMGNTQWLELLDPFVAVKKLYLSREVALRVGRALQELERERVSEVLPSLQYLFLKGLNTLGPIQEAIGKFVGARQLSDSDHPVVVDNWERDDCKWGGVSFRGRRLFTSYHTNQILASNNWFHSNTTSPGFPTR